MLCKKMVQSRGVLHPCGQCTFCRINSKREWISRLLLEAACHPYNQFWTLTYEEESLPTCCAPQPAADRQSGVQGEAGHGNGTQRQTDSADGLHLPGPQQRRELDSATNQLGTLFQPDLARFFKRLRRRHGQFRFYAVGEYGERLGRPHYHVLAFGIALSPESLRDVWGMGHVHIGNVEAASINYCVEYALKREKREALIDLRRQPEFAVMSRNPGIGAYALSEIRQAIMRSQPLPSGELLIPDYFTLLGKKYPVPRFLRNMLEDEGFLYAPKAVREHINDKAVLQALLARSALARSEFKKYEILFDTEENEEYIQLAASNFNELRQRIRNAEARQKLFGVRHETL